MKFKKFIFKTLKESFKTDKDDFDMGDIGKNIGWNDCLEYLTDKFNSYFNPPENDKDDFYEEKLIEITKLLLNSNNKIVINIEDIEDIKEWNSSIPDQTDNIKKLNECEDTNIPIEIVKDLKLFYNGGELTDEQVKNINDYFNKSNS
jgi:hypothetical protein